VGDYKRDTGSNSFAGALPWFPVMGENRLNSNFGDVENHQRIATRRDARCGQSAEDSRVAGNGAFEDDKIRQEVTSSILKSLYLVPITGCTKEA
jgi:hypothetical protein